MSHAMDKAMMALSLEHDDEPFDMPDLPEFKSSERNSRSLIGRILNPDCQKMPGLIQDMLRKWQKQGKVRGIALSKERFQFIFDHEHDLVEVLEKGVHTFNDWTLAIDRWVERPPDDYLQFIPIWIQIRNLPLNYYTEKAITALGEKLGAVMFVAFDPDKPQIQDFVRIQVRFDVSRPLIKTKVINLPEGGSTVVRFNYERVQKRCYECQRLNHEQDVCPLLVKKRREAASERRERVLNENKQSNLHLPPDDPLFGVLTEDQVGVCKVSGRRKIAPELLEEMRRYMMMATDEDKLIRIDRVRSSVAEAEKDPISQKTVLRLEPAPIFTKQLDKGKGLVFDLDLNKSFQLREEVKEPSMKLMASAMNSVRGDDMRQHVEDLRLIKESEAFGKDCHHASISFQATSTSLEPFGRCDAIASFERNSTEYGAGSSVSRPSGVVKKNFKPRRRPYVKKRREQKSESTGILQELYGAKEGSDVLGAKRKAEGEGTDVRKGAWRKEPRVVPTLGPPKSQ